MDEGGFGAGVSAVSGLFAVCGVSVCAAVYPEGISGECEWDEHEWECDGGGGVSDDV